MIVANPLATGLVSNLARPEGNLTGISSTSTDLAGKRLGLLRELRPGATRIAFLGAANDQNTRTFVQETAAAANSLGVQLQPVLVTGPEEFEAAFAAMTKERSDGVIVQPLFIGHRARLVELAMQARLPMIADQGQFAASGALATYGIDRHASSKRLAHYVDRVLNGVKPADLPIEQPTRFRLIINVRTAKALGLTVPTKLLFTADEVIEYLPRPRGGVAQGQCRPRQPRSIEGDVGHRALPHGGARRPCRALREVRAHSHRLQLLPYGQIQ